jgi:hypothetical protein
LIRAKEAMIYEPLDSIVDAGAESTSLGYFTTGELT